MTDRPVFVTCCCHVPVHFSFQWKQEEKVIRILKKLNNNGVTNAEVIYYSCRLFTWKCVNNISKTLILLWNHSSNFVSCTCYLKQKNESPLVSFTCSKSTQDQLRDLIEFQENVMKRIMNNDFLQIPRMVFLSQKQLCLINQVVSNTSRPGHRLVKSIPTETSTFALVLPDYCCLPLEIRRRFTLEGPVMSVEIKPKQGFLPSSESLPLEMMVKSQVSRFCLKQFHKVRLYNFIASFHY